MRSIFIFLGIILLTSCSDLKRPEQQSKLDLIDADLSLLNDKNDEIPIDSISVKIQKLEEVEARIKDNFQYDTLSIDLVENLDNFKRIQPTLMFVLNAKKRIDTSLSVREKSLESLKADIENSVGNRAKYNEFLTFEKNQVEQLSDFVNYCDSSSKESMKTFHNLHPIIESFSFKLEEENQEQ